MLDTTSKLLIGIGLIVAVVVGAAVFVLVNGAQSAVGSTVTVVVARQNIPERTQFTASNVDELLSTRRLPGDAVQPSALRSLTDAVGRVTLLPLAQGEILLNTPDRLASGEAGSTRPSAAIPRDKVALAIAAGESVTVAGALQPGDRVDVIGTWTTPSGQAISQTLFQDVRVFAVGPWQGMSRAGGTPPGLAAPTTGGSSVTLLLDYQQAVTTEYLLQTGGRLSLALRRFDQGEDVPTEPVTAESLTRRALESAGRSQAPQPPITPSSP